jgi:DNA-binding FadR family transcriptional regulator
MNTATFFERLSGAAQSLLARPRGVADFQEARMLFECGLARYAARYASPKEIDALRVALVQNKKCIGNYFTFSKTDVAFHNVLAEIPRNPIFAALNSALSEWLMKQRTVSIRAPVRGAMKQAYEGHLEMFEAIAAHDIEAADKATSGHLEVVSKYYWKAIDSKSGGAA